MRSITLVLLGTSLAASTTLGRAQPGDGPARAVRPELAPAVRINTVARDGWPASAIVGGHVGESAPACLSGTRAYLARYGEDGAELWRKLDRPTQAAPCAAAGDCGLFADLASIDASYIVSSSVRQVLVDPGTGNLVVLSDVTTAWQVDGDKPHQTLAQGALVTRLSSEATLLADAYFGARPDGPPVPAVHCGEVRRPPLEKIPAVDLAALLEAKSQGTDETLCGQQQLTPVILDLIAPDMVKAVFSPVCFESPSPMLIRAILDQPGGDVDSCWHVRFFLKEALSQDFVEMGSGISLNDQSPIDVLVPESQGNAFVDPSGQLVVLLLYRETECPFLASSQPLVKASKQPFVEVELEIPPM